MDNEGYEPRVTPIEGEEIVVTERVRAQAFWLIRKYTSYTYLERMHALYASFVGGYEGYASNQPSQYASWYRQTLKRMYDDLAAVEKGLKMLKQGQLAGYQHVAEGVDFSEYLTGMRFDSGRGFEAIGYRPPPEPAVGLYSWASTAIAMAHRVMVTLGVSTGFERRVWTYTELLQSQPGNPKQSFPVWLHPLTESGEPIVILSGDETPVQGIWQPMDIPNGCPNYILVRVPAPQARLAVERLDFPFFPGGEGTPPSLARTEYSYAYKPTRWKLLWAENRYVNGEAPEEQEFLDMFTDFPSYPPSAG